MSLRLPNYQQFLDSIAILNLPISPSELHGVICGYLCAGEGEAYLRALTLKANQTAAKAMFDIFSISQQQLSNFDFEFELLLPSEEEPLTTRAQAFSQWCEGFNQGITMAGIGYEQLQEDEAKEALKHLVEFASLDYENIEINEDDEKALMEISEYARLAVMRIYSDLLDNLKPQVSNKLH